MPRAGNPRISHEANLTQRPAGSTRDGARGIAGRGGNTGRRHATHDRGIADDTAHALSGERERCLSHGMTDYLAKPFKGHDLFALVEGTATPKPAAAPLPETLAPPVDLEGFRMTLREAGAEQALYSIVDTFVRQAPDRLAALAAATATGSGADMAKAAHVFRGASATIGARELAELLERIETSARAGEIQDAQDTFERVSPITHRVIDYLRQQQRVALTEE